jgi:hypothetical protein
VNLTKSLQFDLENVKTDKDRESYLGHSLMAPFGRWQEGIDHDEIEIN